MNSPCPRRLLGCDGGSCKRDGLTPRRNHIVEVTADEPDVENTNVPCIVSVGIVEPLITD